MPYGVEGFAPSRHLEKEDKTKAKVDETLDFKVIEFSKENKKIIVSHTRIAQDMIEKEKAQNEDAENKEKVSTAKATKKLADKLEKTTLGDIDALANLKEEMEKNNQ